MAAPLTISNATSLFKIKYGKISENVYNSANVLLGRVKKEYDLVGRRIEVAVPFSFGGGVGGGGSAGNTLPTANTADYQTAQITPVAQYSVCSIDRQAMKASLSSEGAFVQGTKHIVAKTVESWMRNMTRVLMGAGDGSVARGLDGAANVAGNGSIATPYLVTLNTDQVEARVEEKDFWWYDDETTNLEVVLYNPTTRVVSLVGTSVKLAALVGVGPVPTAKNFYMQQSRNVDPSGLKQVVRDATGSSTLYGLAQATVGRRWQATQIAAGGAGITVDLLNQAVLEVERKSGKTPNLIVMSYTQFRKYLNLLEDQKVYMVDPRSADLKGKISFKGVEFMSSAGPVPVFPERMVENDACYILNDNFITIHHRPDFGKKPALPMAEA